MLNDKKQDKDPCTMLDTAVFRLNLAERRSSTLVYTSRRIDLHLDGFSIQFALINLELNRLERKLAALKLSGDKINA